MGFTHHALCLVFELPSGLIWLQVSTGNSEAFMHASPIP